MNPLLVLLVTIANAGQPVQTAANARLREVVRSATLAATISVGVTTLLLGVAAACGFMGRGTFAQAARAPWWVWFGGACGAASVLTNLVALPRISATTMIAASVFGQLTAAAVLDHFGWLGVERVPLGLPRVLGIALLAVGVLLASRK